MTTLLGSIEFYLRGSLRGAAASRHNLGAEVILTAHRIPGQTAQHRDLAGVRQRVGNGALKQTLGGTPERSV